MEKEQLLKDLLKTLIDNRLTKLEKKTSEEMKDIKLLKTQYTKQKELLKSFILIKKPNNKQMQKHRTTREKLSSSSRAFTPSFRQIHVKSKEIENTNNKKNEKNEKKEKTKDNVKNLNKSKINGNFNTNDKFGNSLTKKNTINNTRNNNNFKEKIKKFKTPVKQLFNNNTINSTKKIIKKKGSFFKRNQRSTSLCIDVSASKNDNSKIGHIKNNKTELFDSENQQNKSHILRNSTNIFNKSNMNISSSIYGNDISCNNGESHTGLGPGMDQTSLKKDFKLGNIKKNKDNLNLEQYLGKDKMKKNENKIYDKNNFGEWLETDDGCDFVFSISNYLDTNTKCNLFSCHKKYLKYLYHLIEDTYTEFKENNKIMPNSNKIQEKINEIKEKYSPNILNINNTQFYLSRGTLKAFELLNDDEHEKFFNNDKYYLFSDDIYMVYKIIFQLIKNNEVKKSENKKEFYEKMVIFVHENIENKDKIGDFFKNMVNKFEFTEENVYQIKKIIKGNEEKLKPRNYSQICATTGLVIFLVKDILEYLGLNYNGNKSNPVFILMNLEFLEKVKTKLPNYLKFLKSLIKN